MRVKCLAPEHNIVSAARARTWTTRSRNEGTNHEATAPRILQSACSTLKLLEYIVIRLNCSPLPVLENEPVPLQLKYKWRVDLRERSACCMTYVLLTSIELKM